MTDIVNRAPVSNQAVNQVIYGGAYFGTQHSGSPRPDEDVHNYNFGLRFGSTPQIERDSFVGRESELEQLRAWLIPQPQGQNVVALYGLGGMGKTQLSVEYTRQFVDTYSSIFWLNAKDKSILKAELAALAVEILQVNTNVPVGDIQEEERMVRRARQWLSHPKNNKWLLVLDNYDEPLLPGMVSSTGYDIREFFPMRAQGSILITTRSPQLSFAKRLKLKKLEDVEQALRILSIRSGRIVDGDLGAMTLVKRLDGLPLALATAGTYLNQTADSFGDYLKLYNDSWHDLDKYSDELLDYENRTLYSTWNLSVKRVEAQDPAAVELLRLMAYFDNQDLWYELFEAGAVDQPLWWSEVVKSKARFNYAMTKLHDYSLVEVGAGSYSLHLCLHDWTLEYLNREPDEILWQLAIHCVGQGVQWNTETDYWRGNRRLRQHIQRLNQVKARKGRLWRGMELGDLASLAELYSQLDMNAEAEEMYLLALREYEKAWGPEHTSTLNTVNNLGNLYRDQGKMVEAEQMYLRALKGKEKAWGPEHTSTLNTVNNLGNLYRDQGKMVEAEQMYLRALKGKEKAWGPEHTSTLNTVNNLGILYGDQGKIVEAEQMYLRALKGKEKAWGPEHTSTLDTVNNLGNLYRDQGKMVEAEQMYLRALKGKEKAWGPEHTSTLNTVNNLGNLYGEQGKMVEAEQMYLRALKGYEIARGSDYLAT